MDIPPPQLEIKLARPQCPDDWEVRKATIVQLWEDANLVKLVETMKTEHGEDQYKNQFKKWKLNKNVPGKKMEAIVRIQKRRLDNEEKESEFHFRGKPVPPEKIDRWKNKKHKSGEEEVVSPNYSLAASTPSGVSYSTPASPVSTPSSHSAQDPFSPGRVQGFPSSPGPTGLDFSSLSISVGDTVTVGSGSVAGQPFHQPGQRYDWMGYPQLGISRSDPLPLQLQSLGMNHSMAAAASDASILNGPFSNKFPQMPVEKSSDPDTPIAHAVEMDDYSSLPATTMETEAHHGEEGSVGGTELIVIDDISNGEIAPFDVAGIEADTESISSDGTENPLEIATQDPTEDPIALRAVHPYEEQLLRNLGNNPSCIATSEVYDRPGLEQRKTAVSGKDQRRRLLDGDDDASGVIEINRDEFYSSDSDRSTDSLAHITESEYQRGIDEGMDCRAHISQEPDPNKALRAAARRGDVCLVNTLLVGRPQIDTRSERGMTALHFAAFNGHVDVAVTLLEKGAKVDAKAEGDIDIPFKVFGVNKFLTMVGPEAIHLAIARRHMRAISALLEYQADIDAVDQDGQTPLICAVHLGFDGLVSFLLDSGAHMELEDRYGQTPLSLAAMNGHETIAKLLVENGGKFDAMEYHGWTPLSLASENGHEAIVKLLVKNGANIEREDRYGRTPLSLAAMNGHETIAKLLVENGANIEAIEYNGQTPLSLASENGHKAIVKLLVKNGADIEREDGDGQTPVSLAAMNGHETIAKLLVEDGANIELEGRCGRTPLSLAAMNGHGTTVKLLQPSL
ncbi:hypothetical protein DL768_007763 [Monosporascus sp. mg162]|nr:hypothetical protein DL768_007763 [Monosporascus sp. mg162]